MRKAAVLWTGGKDSSLAFHQASLLGDKITGLITFVPHAPEFLAHPLKLMKYQAEAIGLPHYIIEVSEPFKKSYEAAIYSLQEKQQINILITGDIAEIDGQPNWIRECSKYAGVEVLTPLWGWERHELMERLFSYNFKVIFSCVKKPWFTKEWLGKELNRDSLRRLSVLSAETGLDICGEQGEYHTLVLDGPQFKQSIVIANYLKRVKGSLMYMDIQKVGLVPKST